MKLALKLIFFPVKLLIRFVLFLLALLTLWQIAYYRLQKLGIIKSEWIFEKTPSGKGLRFVMSFLDKVFISFQI